MLKKRFLEILKTNGIKENYAKVLYYLIQMDGGEACCKDVSEALNLPKQRVGDALRYLEKEKLKARMLLQIHDELLFEVPEKELKETAEAVKAAMEKAVTLKIPLVVDVKTGKNWQDLKKWKKN